MLAALDGAADTKGSGSTERVRLTRASSLEPKRVRYAWHRRFPLAAVSLLAGEGGLGKSMLTARLMADGTTGVLPGDFDGPVNVLMASAEDAAAEVMLPRAMAAGADLDRLAFLDNLDLPDDLELIAERAMEFEARLIFIDPVVAFISAATNTYRDQDVRQVLKPASKLAEDNDLALVAVMHLNKGESSSALNRIGGSVGFRNAARSVVILGRDPEDPDGERGPRRVLAHAKSNYGPEAPSMLMRIEGQEIVGNAGEVIPTSQVILMGESDVGADELVRAQDADERSATDEAATFLRDTLEAGPVPAVQVKAAADETGISETTLNRVKRKIGVKSTRPGGKGAWLWELPTKPGQEVDGPLDAQSPISGHLDHLDHLAPDPHVERGLDSQRELDSHGGKSPLHAHARGRTLTEDELADRILAEFPGSYEVKA